MVGIGPGSMTRWCAVVLVDHHSFGLLHFGTMPERTRRPSTLGVVRKFESTGSSFAKDSQTAKKHKKALYGLLRSPQGLSKPALLSSSTAAIKFRTLGSTAMSVVLFRCPTTGKSIDIGIESDRSSLDSLRGESIEIQCPHCSSVHSFKMKDARLRDHRLAE